mmetsp:Transcript_103299/g.143936  ORF Transcript_103299/g.143936 Transcript_103299/m.143936 type:complete len:84 (+) Transcript_103299:217-468(+)
MMLLQSFEACSRKKKKVLQNQCAVQPCFLGAYVIAFKMSEKRKNLINLRCSQLCCFHLNQIIKAVIGFASLVAYLHCRRKSIG